MQEIKLQMGQVITFEKCTEIRKGHVSVWPSTVAGWVILIVSVLTILLSSAALGSYLTDGKLPMNNARIGDNSDVK